MAYDFIANSALVVELSYFRERNFVLSPRHWGQCTIPISLSWTIVRFHPAEIPNVPSALSGVYSFVLQPGIANHPACSYLLYIGKAENQSFRDRFRQYLREKNEQHPRRIHVVEMLRK
jgi:hypothetical protein